jgi:hypothetical protein
VFILKGVKLSTLVEQEFDTDAPTLVPGSTTEEAPR